MNLEIYSLHELGFYPDEIAEILNFMMTEDEVINVLHNAGRI